MYDWIRRVRRILVGFTSTSGDEVSWLVWREKLPEPL
jgi:hypothetical protein